MKHTAFAAAVLLSAPLMFTNAPAFAADATSTEQFVQNVAASDTFEIQSGRMAASQADNGEVKSFGQRMVDDHTKTSDQLLQLVKQNDIKVELPTPLDDKHQAKLDKLKDLSGNDFDKTYISSQVKAHEKAVDMFQAYGESGENAELKQWAETTLPALKDHLKQAKALDSEVSKAPAMTENENRTLMSDKHADAMDKTEHDTMMSDKHADAMDKTEHDKKAKAATPANNIKYVTRQAPTDWSAQDLIGKTVENAQGDNLGDINNVILNEKGDVVAVTIGVGGFLGLGEKDVGVPFDALDFRTEAAMADKAKTDETKEERAEEAREARNDPEHDDIQVVLDATREQLENAPAFVWLDQQDKTMKKSERTMQ